ncbi:hypothetical protein BZL29_3598 [Mycobacterium kansasii]|uniref:Uncharacterized protein n=1 Tax=Mycobacterium kansasii TaxID=1768 RepID=A0A1V3XDZ4_MYCKA|nr:hypothetical protein BZL29_3598 [Mycobacterium kansasii]
MFDYLEEHRSTSTEDVTMTSTLLDEALEAHGGLQRWQSAAEIHSRVRSGGLLVRTRVPGNRFEDYRITVDVQEPRTVIDPFPVDGQRGSSTTGRCGSRATTATSSAHGRTRGRRFSVARACGGISGGIRWIRSTSPGMPCGITSPRLTC